MKTWYRLRAARTRAELLIYDEIGQWGKTSQDLNAELMALGDEITALDVRINSPGGDVFEAIAIYNALRRHPAQVVVHVDALCASAATLVALGGDEVRMADNAMWMIHEPWTVAMGDTEALQKQADVLDTLAETITQIYARKTGAEPDTLRDWMRAETWLTAAEAQQAGFVDALEAPLQIAALARAHDVSQFRNVPKRFAMQTEVTESPPVEPEVPATPEVPEAAEAIPAAPAPAPLDAVAIARLCLDAREPSLMPLLLASPLTPEQVQTRLTQATAVRRVCALARTPELAEGLIAAGVDEAGAKLATWERLVARAEASPVDATVPVTPGSQLPVEERCAAEWAQKPALRAEFGTLAAYTAFVRATADGLIKQFVGGKTA